MHLNTEQAATTIIRPRKSPRLPCMHVSSIFINHAEHIPLSQMKGRRALFVFIYGAGTRAVNSKPRGSEKLTRRPCFSSKPLSSSLRLMRHVPNDCGHFCKGFFFLQHEQLITFFQTIRWWWWCSQRRFALCFWGFLPDDTVLYVSASCAPTQRQQCTHMLIWANKRLNNSHPRIDIN